MNNDIDRRSIQNDLYMYRLIDWSEKWQMPFNTNKCKVMHLGRSNSQFQYLMNNHTLEAVVEEKDLGLCITNNLKPSRQCQQAYAKASKALALIAWTISYKKI